jgi:hypothetical protein
MIYMRGRMIIGVITTVAAACVLSFLLLFAEDDFVAVGGRVYETDVAAAAEVESDGEIDVLLPVFDVTDADESVDGVFSDGWDYTLKQTYDDAVPYADDVSGVFEFYCHDDEAVPGYPGWYQSAAGAMPFLLFGQTDGLENYIGKSIMVYGAVTGENLGLDKLYKHLPIFVYGFVAGDSFGKVYTDEYYPGEYVTLTGTMELQTPGRLLFYDGEYGCVLIQTDISDFNEENFSHRASFSGYLYPVSDAEFRYLLIVNGYMMLDY